MKTYISTIKHDRSNKIVVVGIVDDEIWINVANKDSRDNTEDTIKIPLLLAGSLSEILDRVAKNGTVLPGAVL